jgi:uncharacterized membrane protein YfcA
MGGPPVVLYLLGREKEIESYRATLLAFFLPSGVLSTVALLIVGRVDLDVLTVVVVGLPAVAAGIAAGNWLRGHLDAQRFRRIVVGVLLATSVTVTALAIAG